MTATYEPEVIPGLPPAQDTLAQKFAAFDAKEPWVYIAIRNRILAKAQDGAKYLSMKGIFESFRGSMKLNNNYTSFYTDKLIAEYPELAPLFHRRARAQRKMKRVYAK